MITITRKDLYEKVWSIPTTKLSEVFGISDVAIAKLCKKFKIPKPSRGYWEKIRCGHAAQHPPLPPAEGDIPEETTIRPSTHKISNAKPTGGTPFISPEDFKLPPDLKSAHPLIRETLKQLIVAGKPRYSTDQYHRLRHSAAATLDIRVSVEGLPRALKIMEALIRGLESKGLSVLVYENPQPWRPLDRFTTQVSGFEHPVSIHIEELSKRVKYVPPNGRPRWSYDQRFDYRPTGKLRLVMDEYCEEGYRRQWDVTDDESLGETLTTFTDTLAATAKVLRLREIKHEREKREIELRQRREYEEEEQRRELNAAASKWAEAQQLRSFLSAFKNEISRKDQYSGTRSRLGLWLEWVEGYINSLDPIPRLIKDLEKDSDRHD